MCALRKPQKFEETMLHLASVYAHSYSGCKKVQVGAVIAKGREIVSLGANRTIPWSCKEFGCLREKKYGECSKVHRNPEDCSAIHAELDAVVGLTKEQLEGATLYVTRYPCEACARLIVRAGISRVVYGRGQKISEDTKTMFNVECIVVEHVDWEEADVVE